MNTHTHEDTNTREEFSVGVRTPSPVVIRTAQNRNRKLLPAVGFLVSYYNREVLLDEDDDDDDDVVLWVYIGAKSDGQDRRQRMARGRESLLILCWEVGGMTR